MKWQKTFGGTCKLSYEISVWPPEWAPVRVATIPDAQKKNFLWHSILYAGKEFIVKEELRRKKALLSVNSFMLSSQRKTVPRYVGPYLNPCEWKLRKKKLQFVRLTLVRRSRNTYVNRLDHSQGFWNNEIIHRARNYRKRLFPKVRYSQRDPTQGMTT